MACRFGGRFVASSAVSNRLEKFASLRRKRSGEEEAELSEPDHERRLEEPEVLSDGDVAVVMSNVDDDACSELLDESFRDDDSDVEPGNLRMSLGGLILSERRVVELWLLAERLEKGCYACSSLLRLIDCTKEERFGLASVLHVKCRT